MLDLLTPTLLVLSRECGNDLYIYIISTIIPFPHSLPPVSHRAVVWVMVDLLLCRRSQLRIIIPRPLTLWLGKCRSGSFRRHGGLELGKSSNTWMITGTVSKFQCFVSSKWLSIIRSLSIPNSSQSQVCTSQLFNRSLLVDGLRFSALVYTVYLYVYTQG